MSSFLSRVKEFLGFGEPLADFEEDEEFELYREDKRPAATGTAVTAPVTPATGETPVQPPSRRRVRPGGNVIGMPSNGNAEVLVIEPRSFEEAPQIVEHLRSRKSVILNLTLMDSDQAQRSVDFVAGATYAIDGHQERVGEGIFLFTPSTVTISSEMPSQLRTAAQGFGGNFRMNPDSTPRRAQG